MDNYKITYIFNGKEDINDIFIKVLKKEISVYIDMISKEKNRFLLYLEGDKRVFK